MKIVYFIICFTFLNSCCPSKEIFNEPISSPLTLSEIQILAKDCNYVKKIICNPFEPILNNIYDQNKDIVYKYDFRVVELLGYTNCFKGASREQMVDLLGQPSWKRDHCYYLYSASGKCWSLTLYYKDDFLYYTDVGEVKISY